MDAARQYESPVFPLNTPVMPGMVVPLRIFEPRYRELAGIVTAGAGWLATVMIERGSEVGGDDQRSDVGCTLQVTEHQRFQDGTWTILTIACKRIRVLRWLDDAPYPRALIQNWPDQPDSLEDLAEQTWRLAAALGVGELDRQRLLLAPSSRRRLELLREMAEDQRGLIDLMSQHGGDTSR